jgi:UDP-N-acetyl-D-glucosamine dehydrogenase
LNEKGKAIKGSRILILGIAYKKNVDDVRESPAAEIMELLRERGARLDYSDPHVPAFPKMREHSFELSSVPVDAKALAAYDCVVLVTDHDAFDYEAIAQHARLLVDTRGRYPKPAPNIVKA